MLTLLILWPVLAVIVGAAAHARGRSGIGWFLLAALLLSPLIAGILSRFFQTGGRKRCLKTLRALLKDIRDVGAVDDRALRKAMREGRRRL